MMVHTPVIQTHNLTKLYKTGKTETLALDHLNLEITSGEIFGFLGPNGAGKTTTIRLLLDLIRPTKGSVQLFGQDVQANAVELHRRIGFLPGELNLWKNQRASAIIRHLAEVRAMDDLDYAHELAERLKLDTTKKMRDYSTGNKRKLGLVIAMMHRPDLLLLDEPTSGLDPLMQQEFYAIVREMRKAGHTVFLSSHVLSEVQAICDRVGIIREGRLRAVEAVERLTHVDFRWVEFLFREPVSHDIRPAIESVPGASNVHINENIVRVRLRGSFDPLLRIVDDAYIEDIRIEKPSLEEIFLTYYGNGINSKREHMEKELVS